MYVPQKIADKVREYMDQKAAAKKHEKEASEWLEKNTDLDYISITELFEINSMIRGKVQMPKEISEKIQAHVDCWLAAGREFRRVWDWLKANTRIGDVFVTDIFLTDTPMGTYQGEGEFHRTLEDEACEAISAIWGDDPDAGTHYHAIEDSRMYLGYSYESM